jgi:hypothetical protein
MTKKEKKLKKNFVMRRGTGEPTSEWLNEKAKCELCSQEYYVHTETHVCDIDKLYERVFKETFDQSSWGAEGSEAFEQALKIGFRYVKDYHEAYVNKFYAAPGG